MAQMQELSYPRNKINVLLLENVHQSAVNALKEAGYNVSTIAKSLTEAELAEQIGDIHVLGIRSRTKLNPELLAMGKQLLAVGCFGIGTNQVSLDAATSLGVVVFNAPYGSTRSVAELAVADVIMLARRAAHKNNKMHSGQWDKPAPGAVEVRGKSIGVIGYGHIGSQVGLLAESIGMEVLFYDKQKRLHLGRARSLGSIEELLAKADFVTLHVPAPPAGRALIGSSELAKMKKGSYLINLGRGNLIDLKAVKEALEAKQLSGVALDVYVDEPKENRAPYQNDLAGMDNVILTPHIGGSTEEAQYNIGLEVAQAFIKFIDSGNTEGAVNFPQASLPPLPDSHRILNIHKNVPGVVSQTTKLLSDIGANIDAQYLGTFKDIGYLIMDINKELSEEVKKGIAGLPTSIKTRILF